MSMDRDSFAGEAGYGPDERAGVVHPAIGLIGALIAAVILGSVGSGSEMLPVEPAERIGYVVGGVAVVTFVPWLALFFLSLRHRHPLWWGGELLRHPSGGRIDRSRTDRNAGAGR